MSEQRCESCKWIRDTGTYTPYVCSIAVPLWVTNSRNLEARQINRLSQGCPTYEARVEAKS